MLAARHGLAIHLDRHAPTGQFHLLQQTGHGNSCGKLACLAVYQDSGHHRTKNYRAAELTGYMYEAHCTPRSGHLPSTTAHPNP